MAWLAIGSDHRGDAATRPPAASAARATSDPIPALFAEVQARLSAHESALAEADQLEARLIVAIGYPRVRVSSAADTRPRFAADRATIERHVPLGRQRERLQRALHRRQRRWAEAVRAIGLTAALQHEATAGEAGLVAISTLLSTPGPTVTGVTLKLLVLLSWQEPGIADRDLSPWRELRIILADLDRLASGDCTVSLILGNSPSESPRRLIQTVRGPTPGGGRPPF